jgi:hypothetical protein
MIVPAGLRGAEQELFRASGVFSILMQTRAGASRKVYARLRK